MYGMLRVGDFTTGQFVQKALSFLRQGKAIDYSLVFNAFDRIAFDFFPSLDKYRKVLAEAGAPGVCLAGSGPCLFAFFSAADEAGELFSHLMRRGLECYLAFSVSR